MLRKIIIAAFFFTAVVSCGKSKSGFKYSQDLVAKEKSLQADIEMTETKVEEFVNSGQYDSIAAVSARMESLVQKKIDEIEKMPTPNAKGVDTFKAAVIRYFNYMKSMYTAYKNWGAAATEEERQAEMGTIQKLVEEKMDAIGDMQAAQKKYADANGFKIEK